MRAAALSLALAAMLAGCAGGAQVDDRRRAFLGRAGEPSAVIAAELAFARLARERGTWTAFRQTATDDAIWPSPGWVNVKASLKDRSDPAQAIVWEPDRVIVSCDGSFALSTGPATYPSGKRTRFATVWQRQEDGRYRWVLDQGFDLAADYDKPEMIAAEVADCGERAPAARYRARRSAAWQSGASDDGTLVWESRLAGDCSRVLTVQARKAGALAEVFRAAAPPPAGTPPAACRT